MAALPEKVPEASSRRMGLPAIASVSIVPSQGIRYIDWNITIGQNLG